MYSTIKESCKSLCQNINNDSPSPLKVVRPVKIDLHDFSESFPRIFSKASYYSSVSLDIVSVK